MYQLYEIFTLTKAHVYISAAELQVRFRRETTHLVLDAGKHLEFTCVIS